MELSSPKPRKISLIIPTLRRGGAERVVSLLSLEFARRGYEVAVILFDNLKEYPAGGRVISLGIRQPRSRVLRKVVNTFAPVIPLRRILRRERPDIAVSFLNNIAPIMTLCPMYASIHTSYRRLSFLDKLALRTIYHFSSVKGVIVPSENLRRILAEHSDLKKISVIPNPVDLAEIRRAGAESPDPTSPADFILAVGRLVSVKRFDYLVRVFAASGLSNKTELVILGAGPEKERLEDLARKLAPGKIKFPGALPNPFPFMRNARFLALTSRTEVFPNVLIESMASGTPAVSVNCDYGPREIITDGRDGLLVEPDDEEALARAMERLYDDASLREELGRNCLEATERYSVERIAESWEKFLTV